MPAWDHEIAATQAHWRARGARDLQLAPYARAGEHLLVVLNRHLDGAVTQTGLDLAEAAEPTAALNTARAARKATASATYVLLRDRRLPAAEQQRSFVLTVPVYAAGGARSGASGAFLGWLVMGLRGEDFMRSAVHDTSDGMVQVTLADASSGTPMPVAGVGTAGPATTP